jgi:hypothetical protein
MHIVGWRVHHLLDEVPLVGYCMTPNPRHATVTHWLMVPSRLTHDISLILF